MAYRCNSTPGEILPVLDTVPLEREGHILLVGLNRAPKRNSFDGAVLAGLSRAYALLESDTSVRATVASAHLARAGCTGRDRAFATRRPLPGR